MKQKHNGGFSLIETVVAIAILGLIVVPCCSGLLMSIRINEKAQQMMQAQLAVSSAVETLMAEGIKEESDKYDVQTVAEGNTSKQVDAFPDVTVATKKSDSGAYFTVTVSDNNNLVTVTTTIRKVVAG